MSTIKIEVAENEFKNVSYSAAPDAFNIKVTGIKKGNFSDQIRATVDYGDSAVEGLFQWYNNNQYLDDWSNENGNEIPYSLYIREAIELLISRKELKVKK